MKIGLSIVLIILSLNAVWGQEKVDSTRQIVRSAKINGQKFTAIFKETKHGRSFSVLNKSGHSSIDLNKGSLYLDDGEGVSSFDFVDINEDGYKDLLIEYYTNVPGIQDLLLYDKVHKAFVPIQGFPRFPSSIHIPGTNLFYSYHRSGCADMNWDSDLFAIKNFKIIKLGNVSGIGCASEKIQEGIFVYKIKGQKKTLLKKYPIDTISYYKDQKWGFIKEYWMRHYKNFISH